MSAWFLVAEFSLQERPGNWQTVRAGSGEEPQMMNAFGMVGIIVLFVAIVVLLDWWGWRKERQSRDRAA